MSKQNLKGTEYLNKARKKSQDLLRKSNQNFRSTELLTRSKQNVKSTELLNKSKQNIKNTELVIKSKQNLLKSSDSKPRIREKCTKCVDAPSIRRTLKAKEDRKKAESTLVIDDSTNLPDMFQKPCKCEVAARALKGDLASIQGMSRRRADIDAMCDLCEDEPTCGEPKEEEEGESENKN